mmetsp:Transcript_45150/g.104380  ORF Transcript_45150/g.104380 Transcript_45150/m.104380 type:complete len:168 (+) Transcript_45150:70-573(+)
MEVILEKVPQNGKIGPVQIAHWAIRVGDGKGSVCYEFESEGVQIGAKTTCDHGYAIERHTLGVTQKTHEQIRVWALKFDARNNYQVAGCDFGGRNCQDFAWELCHFLGVGTERLPWRQARQAEAALGSAVAAAGAVAVGCALLSALAGRHRKENAPKERRQRKGFCC